MSLYLNFGRLKLIKIKINYILDIGANEGEFSDSLKKIFPNCTFQLIEPNTDLNIILEKKGYDFYNFLLYKEKDKKVKLYFEDSGNTTTGNSIYKENSRHYEQNKFKFFTTHILDEFTTPDIIDLIKIDVQGAEIDVFKGGIQTLKKTKFILVETSLVQYNLNAPLEKSVIEFLSNYSFTSYIEFDRHIWNDSNLNSYNLKRGDVFQRDLLFINNKLGIKTKLKFEFLKLYIYFKNLI